jgi:hypothetical protein
VGVEKMQQRRREIRAAFGDHICPGQAFVIAQNVCRRARQIREQFGRALRAQTLVACDDQQARLQSV